MYDFLIKGVTMTCVSCKFVGTVNAPAGEENGVPVVRAVNVCRCNPPQALLVHTPQGQQALTVWPQIDPKTDVCGSYFLSSSQ